jgi:DNA primase
LDNDIAGRKATKALQTILTDKYEVVDDPPKCGKDVNDFLCIKLGISKKHERSFER